MKNSETTSFRCGYTAILGRPNVGKSTLLNGILAFKLSIVTPKPQTTRHRVLGIYNDSQCQIIFIDTPGLITPKYKLHEYLLQVAESAAREADLNLLLIEAGAVLRPEDLELIEKIAANRKALVVALSKIDRVDKKLLLPQMEALASVEHVKEIIPISALKNDGIKELLAVIKSHMPAGPALYPPDQLTTAPERFFAAEIIREKIFLLYGEEIPYSTTVNIEEFTEHPGKKDYIRAVICVERESQKGILIGKKGQALKKAGRASRDEIELFLGRQVFLDLVVIVRPKWRQKETLLKELGYSKTE